MSFNATNPISSPKVETSPTPITGTRGLFPKNDGWYDIDDNGKIKKFPTAHTELDNLNFKDSGHTGFQAELSETQLANIDDVPNKEDTSHKVTAISASSTDAEYPSAKAVYDIVNDKGTVVYRFRGSIYSGNLYYMTSQNVGDVYNLADNAYSEFITENPRISCYVYDMGDGTMSISFDDTSILNSFSSGDKLYIGNNGEYVTLKTYYSDMQWTSDYNENIPDGTYEISKIEYNLDLHPGDNVAWIGHKWDKLAGTVDLSNYATKDDLGDIETALDGIIAIQESIIGGESA